MNIQIALSVFRVIKEDIEKNVTREQMLEDLEYLDTELQAAWEAVQKRYKWYRQREHILARALLKYLPKKYKKDTLTKQGKPFIPNILKTIISNKLDR